MLLSEAAKLLGLTPGALWHQVRAGKLKARKQDPDSTTSPWIVDDAEVLAIRSESPSRDSRAWVVGRIRELARSIAKLEEERQSLERVLVSLDGGVPKRNSPRGAKRSIEVDIEDVVMPMLHDGPRPIAAILDAICKAHPELSRRSAYTRWYVLARSRLDLENHERGMWRLKP
jgi:hypothetical protein